MADLLKNLHRGNFTLNDFLPGKNYPRNELIFEMQHQKWMDAQLSLSHDVIFSENFFLAWQMR